MTGLAAPDVSRGGPAPMHDAWWQQPLPIARYQFEAQVLDPLQMPAFAGSLLRGQFGAALRTLACNTAAPHCTACPHTATCTYARVFDGALPPNTPHAAKGFAQVPNPYVLVPEPESQALRPGDVLRFGLVLVGHAVQQLPLLAAAWQLALAQGLGPRRARARLARVLWLGPDGEGTPPATVATLPGAAGMAPHAATLQVPPSPWQGGELHLELCSPLRLQQQSGLVGAQALTAPLFLAAVVRRVGLLLALHAGEERALAQSARVVQWAHRVGLQAHLQWQDHTRYSARQRQEMTLGGLLGSITLHAENAATAQALWPWLWLGQWLHMGKNATMGLGAYRLIPDGESL